MTDLVERLRFIALKANFPSTIDDLNEAADEIIRLREALDKIVNAKSATKQQIREFAEDTLAAGADK